MSEQIIDLGEQKTVNQQKRSGLATVSLICSLIVCCPIVTLIGVILGIVALVQMRGKQIAGRGLALAGIIIGIVTTVLISLGIAFLVNAAMEVLDQTPKLVTTAIQSGIQGDMEAFRAEFTYDAAAANDEEVTSFIATLTSRYGKFDEAVVDIAAIQGGNESSNAQAEIPLQLVFETQTISSTVVIDIAQGEESWIDIKIQCLLIHDSDNGDLAFPLASQCGASIRVDE
jgi:hypothetical protein